MDDEFGKVFTSINPDKSVENFVHHLPDVLILAFYTLDKLQHYYLGLSRLCAATHIQTHRTIILCNKDEVRQAYVLCRDGIFDDYHPLLAHGRCTAVAHVSASRAAQTGRTPGRRASCPGA